jgi:hypothetical protein
MRLLVTKSISREDAENAKVSSRLRVIAFHENSAAPVPGTPSNVRNREHFDAIGQFLEYDVIRKSSDAQPPRSAS